MGFKVMTDLDASNATALGGVNRKTGKKNPTQVEGYYLGSRKVDSPKSKSGFAYLHILQTATGNLGVWGKTDMDRKVTAVTPGTMIRISHTGMMQTKNGEMYKFQVEVDSDNCLDVASIPKDNSYDAGNDSEDEDENDSTTSWKHGGDDEEFVATPAKVAAPKASFKELLAKKAK